MCRNTFPTEVSNIGKDQVALGKGLNVFVW